jgi:hypothetical protein
LLGQKKRQKKLKIPPKKYLKKKFAGTLSSMLGPYTEGRFMGWKILSTFRYRSAGSLFYAANAELLISLFSGHNDRLL